MGWKRGHVGKSLDFAGQRDMGPERSRLAGEPDSGQIAPHLLGERLDRRGFAARAEPKDARPPPVADTIEGEMKRRCPHACKRIFALRCQLGRHAAEKRNGEMDFLGGDSSSDGG